VLFVVYIIIHPTDISAAAPFSGVFTCSAGGYGYRNIIWHRRNKPIPKKAYSTVMPTVNETKSVLTIPNVTSEDVGIYYCVVWINKKAQQSHTAILFLAGKTH